MKYGDTLRQRSIPEWGHYNIDYDFLKDQIKHQTTPGTNKAVSIPGQGESSERGFRDEFLQILQAQHDRINLFVRSKSGEIERRLDHIGRSLEQLRTKRPSGQQGARLPARTVERYAKIDADVTRTGEEIRSLSRFQVAQRTGFTKILKKYKRWTKDKELSGIFKEEISSHPDSLFQLDLGYLLDQYIDVLGALRSVFDADGTSTAQTENANVQSAAARVSRAINKGDELDFDLVLATTPLGLNGNKATYWVHSDHIVEVQVLLLQQMQLYGGSARASTRDGSTQATPGRRQSSATNIDRYFGNEDDVGLVVLDHAEAFAIRQNASTIGSSEEAQGNIGTKAAGNIRWVSSGKAAVVISGGADLQGQSSADVKTARLERKALQAFLDPSSDPSVSKRSKSRTKQLNGFAKDDPSAVRQWLTENQSSKPIAGVASKRTRFNGLHNNSVGGVWATLDRDVYMKASLHEDLEHDDWASAARSGSTKFPHAILEVRREGIQATSLIQTLDKSHLVERVRGFSLEAHAVWICCKPSAMSQPLWIPLLDKDIRKLPELVRRRSRKERGSTTDTRSQGSPPHTSTSNTSYDGQSSPLASRAGESSATSAQEFVDPPPLQAFRKKHRKPYSDYPPPTIGEDLEPDAPRYWNEYDNPEEEEAGYYIYVDPDAPIKFPGQELIEAWTKTTMKLFGMRDKADVASLSASDDGTTDDEDTADESPVVRTANYGTISSSHQPRPHESYFNNLFHSIVDPRRDSEALHVRRSLLGELETRQHKTEMTKMRFYFTCLATALVIDIILGIMTVTSRKKERGAVDAAVLFGTIATLLLCIVAVLSMKTRRERLGWVHQGTVLSIAASVVALDILLLLWVLRI
ncbi:hypothetical protein BKA66DRAFT_442344 [Pyrenochaeta sp. MPI-SDFR-AT-0127]|nr:hypothetical protein BKA66DRAFT_442344 [Pyrenochaeta sp. MPI-SDFR-AT-0127]